MTFLREVPGGRLHPAWAFSLVIAVLLALLALAALSSQPRIPDRTSDRKGDETVTDPGREAPKLH